MKKIVIVTYIAFWRQNAGHCARLFSMIEHLSQYHNITVIFGGLEEEGDLTLQRSVPFAFKLIYLERKRMLSLEEYSERFRKIIQLVAFEVCIVEYIELSFLLKYIPKDIKVILDTHDIMFQRHESFGKYDILEEPRISPLTNYTKEEELEQFKAYDAIILINPADYAEISQAIDNSKIIVAPHPPKLVGRIIKSMATRVGFIGSSYYPNVDAITYFVKEVWPVVSRERGVTLNIYGHVCDKIKLNPTFQGNNIKLWGFVSDLDLVYNNVDVVINPVRFGAGIKIKNVEALANGLPLLTSVHGARGLESGVSTAFLIAESTVEYKEKLIELIEDETLRSNLAHNAYKYAESHFSPHHCFRSLLSFLN